MKLPDLGRRRKISILEAAAIRTLITLKAEWQNDVDGAVSLAETSVTEFARDEDAFTDRRSDWTTAVLRRPIS
jgi:hypothetical protein